LMDSWFWLNTTYACGGISVDVLGKIRDTPPIYSWMRGKRLSLVLSYLEGKNHLLAVQKLEDNKEKEKQHEKDQDDLEAHKGDSVCLDKTEKD